MINMTESTESNGTPIPPYVLALLDACLTGQPLNFGEHEVPAEVHARLMDAVVSGRLGTVRLDAPGWSDRMTIDNMTRGREVVASLASGRRATLAALRDRLAGILDGTVGHKCHCECECGVPWDTGKVAAIARELREVVRELDDLPGETGGTDFDRIQAERAERRAQAEAEAARRAE